jgi:hypothetical protein
MECMHSVQSGGSNRSLLLLALTLAMCLSFFACKSAQQSDTAPSDAAGEWTRGVDQLGKLNVSNAEISELNKVHDVGLSNAACINLVQLARSRQKPFADGQSIADLISAGSSEQTVLELAHLDQLGLWAGQARILRLAGLSDAVILTVARRRSQNLPVMSGEKLGELKNALVSDATIVDLVNQGINDNQATAYIAQRQRAAGGHGFVYQGSARRKH